jgi:hypothetical protein
MLNTKAVLTVALMALASVAVYAQEDPPDRVARLNYINGNVSMEPAGIDQWAPADINRPFTVGDYLYTDQGAEAELHLDVAVMRMGPNTSFGFLNLDDRTVQIKLTEGDMYFRLHDFGPDQVFEVDTPNAAVTLLRDGIYRFRIDPNGNMSFVVVREGQAGITGGGQSFTLNPGNSATLTGTDSLTFDIEAAPAPDDFDNWCEQRDAREAHLASARYLPPTVIGYEDLDDYGTWQETGDYGPVWYPRSVAAGWAPYQYGHWAWIEPWGWTWVDNTPWGFAPFHYGRWAYIGNRWGWCPGPIARVGYVGPVVRPYYAPALVAWFGGSHWGVSVAIGGGGPSLGWVPLGFGELYTPPYACSRPYFNNVNVYNTRIVKTVNITNVYNTVYVNHTVYNQQYVNVRAPNAVMAMPQTAFASGRPVHQAGAVVRQAELARITPAAVIAPPVAPTRQAVAPTLGRPTPRPPAQVIQRQVVARNTPAVVPAAFTARQQYLTQHVGQLHNFQAMHQAVAPQAHPAAVANVRQAPPARAVAAVPGRHVENAPANNRAPASAYETRQPQPARQAEQPQPPAQARYSEQSRQPAPPAHGTPPNLREGNNNRPGSYTQENQNGRVTERAQPQPRPQQPAYTERTQPATRAPQPAYTERSQPQPRTQQQQAYPERTQPQERTNTQPQREPQTRSTQSAYPEREQRPVETRPAPEPRPATPPRQESRPENQPPRTESRPSPQHGQPPDRTEQRQRAPEHKETRDTRDHSR